jgi:DedD protein
MDSRAKQRLTGAVILVTLFVLLVPALLTGPPSADAPGTAAEEGMRRYTIELNAPNPSAPPSDSETAPPPVTLPHPVVEEPRAKPGESAEPANVVAASPTPAQASPAAPATAPVVTAAAPPAQAPAPAPAAPVEKGSFAVQLGSFRDRDNADRLVRDMIAKGFTAFVAPITSGGRELYRVRVGPTRDRAQAEALAAQLRRVGQSGAIVPIS